jgi:hypothetical protein
VPSSTNEAVVEDKQEKALAEHVARHPEDVGRTVEEFNWIMRVIVRSWQDNQQLELVAGTALERDGPTAEPIKTSVTTAEKTTIISPV